MNQDGFNFEDDEKFATELDEQLAGVETSDMARRTASCSKVFPSSFSPEKKLVTR